MHRDYYNQTAKPTPTPSTSTANKNHHPMHHERKPTYHAYNPKMEKAMRRIKMIPLLKNDDDGNRDGQTPSSSATPLFPRDHNPRLPLSLVGDHRTPPPATSSLSPPAAAEEPKRGRGLRGDGDGEGRSRLREREIMK
ncbi:hypothetical protein Dimus_037879 [Dionaea muscipula]